MTMSRWLGRLSGLMLIAVLLSAAGCNTMEGLGEDIGALGDAISNEANDGDEAE